MSDGVSRRVACATMVTSPSYVIGALVLGYSLRKIGWSRETVVMVSPEISPRDRERLALLWDRLVDIDHVPNPVPTRNLVLASFSHCYTKLRMWELTEYDRVIYLDADTVVLGSLDELINAPEFAAAPCVTAPDQLCAAVMVIKPSKEMFADLVSKIGKLPSYDGSDQGFINSYFNDWFTGPPERRLPLKYNTPRILSLFKPAWDRFAADMGVLHYFGPKKPWDFGASLMPFLMSLLAPSKLPDPSPQTIWTNLRKEMEQACPQVR